MSKSKVVKMYEYFCDGKWSSSMNYTREKNYHVIDKFWYLLISAGFNFQKTDLVDSDVCLSEGHYSLAVRAGNLSFAYAYEHGHDRTPFIGTGLCYGSCWPGFSNHATQSKSAGRLCMGVEFSWQNEKVSVTSFNDKKKSLVACAYHERKDGYRGKVKKRFTVTAEAFRKEMSNRKKSKEVIAGLKKEGIGLRYQENYGWYVVKNLKTKAKYFDTTGEVKAELELKKYKLFTDSDAAVEFAETLIVKKKSKE